MRAAALAGIPYTIVRPGSLYLTPDGTGGKLRLRASASAPSPYSPHSAWLPPPGRRACRCSPCTALPSPLKAVGALSFWQSPWRPRARASRRRAEFWPEEPAFWPNRLISGLAAPLAVCLAPLPAPNASYMALQPRILACEPHFYAVDRLLSQTICAQAKPQRRHARPTPSHTIPLHPTPSHSVPLCPIPSHSVLRLTLSHSVPLRPTPSHLAASSPILRRSSGHLAVPPCIVPDSPSSRQPGFA